MINTAIKGTQDYSEAEAEERSKLQEIQETLENAIGGTGGATPVPDATSTPTPIPGPTFTTVANAPNTKGFNESTTYYVSWNPTPNPTTGEYEINESTNLNGTAPTNWYDYTSGVNHWANIKTTGGDNDCYWVWIPRYAYKVPSRSTAGTIDIKFLSGRSNLPIGEVSPTPIPTALPTAGPTQGSTWVVHPAFTNAGNGGFGELDGIWVAKYEASSNSTSVVENPTTDQLAYDGGSETDTDLKVRVKPNVTSWRSISVANIFTVCQNLTTANNSLAGANNTANTALDSHMMKNTEWGAVAYLSRSIYGKNAAVWNNPYYNNTTNYSPITGLCGKAQNASQTSLNYTEGANDQLYKYNTAGGENASTSGNVYGIYDMAGGTWEYVAGYLSGYSTFNNASYASKYKDVYSSYSVAKYGDAVYETSTSSSGSTSWDSDFSNFVSSSNPVFKRGGHANNGANAGVFAFNNNNGNANTNNSFRPCVVPQHFGIRI